VSHDRKIPLPKARNLTRRQALLVPFVLLGCAEREEAFPPLRYDYLPPIQLNVANIEIEQHFVASGVPPDVTAEDPAPPAEALRAMATGRLQAFGVSGKAVFTIVNASLTRQGTSIDGVMAVSLAIYGADGAQAGFAEARVGHNQTGEIDDTRKALYDITKTMMDNMNVEFEYQVRRNLRAWLTTPAAPDTPVEQTPLTQPQSSQPQSFPAQSLPAQPQSPQAPLPPPTEPSLPPASPNNN
jgi:hypothetical protein